MNSFVHDCNGCKSLGSIEVQYKYDLYFDAVDGGYLTARYGNKRGEYIWCHVSDTGSIPPALREARNRAVAAGLITD